MDSRAENGSFGRRYIIYCLAAFMSHQTKASWVFGVLFAAFILGVFAFGPESLPAYKQQILAYICALLAGCFALFFTGSLLVNTELPIPGRWTVQGGAGFGLFLVVLFWWQSPSALIAKNTSAAMPPSEVHSPKGADSSPEPQFRSAATDQVTLQTASVTFLTGDDDKDFDTTFSVFIEKGGTALAVARDLGNGTPFHDHASYGPFDIPVLLHPSRSDFTGIVTRMAIRTNGNDTWKSKANITIRFSDGAERHQSIEFALSNRNPTQAWDW
jgi:hypothetical protein